jgi:glycerophosphoryl diester phosphodiesterase
MPTLEEALKVCKDRIVVNVDQGFEYYDQVLEITEKLGVTDQILIKGKKPARFCQELFSKNEHNMMYMPIIDILKPQGQALFQEYQDEKIVPLAYEVCFDKITPEVEACFKTVKETGSKLWINSIWGSLCGNLDDDNAYINGTQVYDKLLSYGPTMIQTDRPEFLINYLRSKGLHD